MLAVPLSTMPIAAAQGGGAAVIDQLAIFNFD